MTLWHFVLITFLSVLWVVIRFIVITIRLFRLRYIAKDYNRYVDLLYTQNGRPVPPILGRIQYDCINQYNVFLDKRYILKLLFKSLPIRGEVPVKKCLPLGDDKPR